MEAEKRKQHILDCAKRLFSRRGYYQTQISDIIAEAEIARGTVYQYFEHKDDIFTTLLKNFFDTWQETISTGITPDNRARLAPREYLFLRVKMTLIFFANDPEMCNIVLRTGHGLSGELDSIIRRFEQKIQQLLMSDLEFGISMKVIREDLDAELISNILVGGVLNAVYFYFVKKGYKKKNTDFDLIANRIVDVFAGYLFG